MENIGIKHFDIGELGTHTIRIHSAEFDEGDEMLSLHMVRERSSLATKLAKERFKRRNCGRLFCEICSFDFSETYGDIGVDFIGAHHTKPISMMQSDDVTRIEDFVMVCSNCHSMLHIGKDWISHEQLKEKLIAQQAKLHHTDALGRAEYD